MNVIDNTELINMCNDCGAVGFIPEVSYVFDAEAETVTVTNASTIPAGDGFKKVKIKVHDFFGGTVHAVITVAVTPNVVDVSSLNLSKPLALTVTVITNEGIHADGGAYGLGAAGDVAHWDVQKSAAVA